MCHKSRPLPPPVLTLNLYLPNGYCWANFKPLLQRLGKSSSPKSLLSFQGLNKKAFLRIILLGNMAQRKQSTTCSLKVDSAALVWMCGSSMRARLGHPPHPPGSSVAMRIIHLKTNAGQGCCGQLTKADQQITSLAFPLALPLLLLLLLFLGQWKCYHHSSTGKCLWSQQRTSDNCWQRIQKS